MNSKAGFYTYLHLGTAKIRDLPGKRIVDHNSCVWNVVLVEAIKTHELAHIPRALSTSTLPTGFGRESYSIEYLIPFKLFTMTIYGRCS